MKKQEYTTMFEFEDNYWWYISLHKLIKYYIDYYSHQNKDQVILDAGCGTGKMLELLSDYAHTEGFDLSEDAIAYAKKRNLNNIKLQDINTWQSEHERYSFIISADVICSIGIKDDLEILKNFYDSLQKNGKVILNLPAFKSLKRRHDKAVYIAKRYNRKTLKNELKEIGFKINVATYRYSFLYFALKFKKIFEKEISQDDVESDLKPIPSWLNKLMLLFMNIESFFIKNNIFLPFGSSLFIIAEK